MPFIMKKLFAAKKEKAFLHLIRELEYTQKEAQRLIAKGRLLVDSTPMVKTAGCVEGEFELIVFEPQSKGLEPVFTAPDFVLFDKPSGVLIHPQNRYTPYSLIDEIKSQFGRDANITHRIDQETSGLVLCARNKESERILKMKFQEREMKKSYLALVHGELKEEIIIEEPLLRQESKSTIVRMVVKVDKEGKASKTTVRPLYHDKLKNQTLVEALPLTGRQHQIRVHLDYIGHSIVGDPIYGQKEENIVKFLDKELSDKERISLSGDKRLMLHAATLEFAYENVYYKIKTKDKLFNY